jgi:hypothetical protein
LTVLQEHIENAAKEIEKTERQVVRDKQLITEKRDVKIAILSENSIIDTNKRQVHSDPL